MSQIITGTQCVACNQWQGEGYEWRSCDEGDCEHQGENLCHSCASEQNKCDDHSYFTSCLIAVAGDCASGGLSSEPGILLFGDEHKEIVSDFLRIQLEWSINCHFRNWNEPSDESQELHKRYFKSFRVLKSAGIFQHKWHSRTVWDIAYLGEANQQLKETSNED